MFPSGHKGNIPPAPGIPHVDRPSCGHQSHARNRSRPWRGHRIVWIATPSVLHERRRDTASYDWHGKYLQGERRSRRRRARATAGSSQDGEGGCPSYDPDHPELGEPQGTSKNTVPMGGSMSCDRSRRSYCPAVLGGYICIPGSGTRCVAICSCHATSGPSDSRRTGAEAVRHQVSKGAHPL